MAALSEEPPVSAAAPVRKTRISAIAEKIRQMQQKLARWVRSRAAILILAGVIAPLLIAFIISVLMHRVQKNVTANVLLGAATAGSRPSDTMIWVADEGVSALAWSPGASASLFVGLFSGTVLRVTPSGTVLQDFFSGPGGSIVSLTPTPDGTQPRPVMLSQDPGTDALSYHADGRAVPDGLVVPLSNRLFRVSRVPLATSQSQILTKGPSGQIDDPQQRELDGLLDRWGLEVTITAAGGIYLENATTGVRGLQVVSGEAEAFVVGYGNGAVRVLNWADRRPVVIRQTMSDADVALLHNGAVIAIAGRGSAEGNSVRFATAGANGTVNVYHQEADYLTLQVLRSVSIMRADGTRMPTNPATAAARDGLSLSRNGRVLMLYGQDGGIHIARLADGATGAVAPMLQRYPLTQLRAQRRSGQWTPTFTLAVQRALLRHGVDIGDADGIRGVRTDTGLREFAMANGLGQAAETEVFDALLGAVWRSSAAVLSPRGDLFAIAGNDGTIHLVRLPVDPGADPATAQTVALPGHGDVVTHLAISPDGSYLASAGVDGRLWITDLDKAWLLAGWPLAASPTGPPNPEMTARALDRPAPPASAPSGDDSIIVFGGDTTLAAAQDEIARARRAGIDNVGIYLRDGSYRSVATFPNAQAQAEALSQIQSLSTWSRDAYRTRLSTWCPVRRLEEGFTRCDPAPGGDELGEGLLRQL